MFKPNNKGQSILEYAILLGVILVAILVMQIFIKRGYQGGLKDAAEKMGDAYSASSTWILHNRSMIGNQTILGETATSTGTGAGQPGHLYYNLTGKTPIGTVSRGAYSFENRSMEGNTTSETSRATGSAKGEAIKWQEYANYTITNELENEAIIPP